MPKVQRFEIFKNSHGPIHCLFCGHEVIPNLDGEGPYEMSTCEHTLYSISSEGIDFLSQRVLDQIKKMPNLSVENQDGMYEIYDKKNDDFSHWDLIELLSFDDFLDIKSIEGSPSMMEASIGFAP
jgi:hypothetical protein